MSDNPDPSTEDGAAGQKSKLPLIIGLVLALALGGGGFFVVYSGVILAPAAASSEGEKSMDEEVVVEDLPELAFVPVQPIVINLGSASSKKHLKFVAQLEVNPAYQSEVENLLPRVTDVFNGYLRAISVQELEDSRSLIRLRAQMLRRAQVVTGEGRIRDLLIMEFVIN